jgi:hypothetical protein
VAGSRRGKLPWAIPSGVDLTDPKGLALLAYEGITVVDSPAPRRVSPPGFRFYKLLRYCREEAADRLDRHRSA